MQRPSKSVVTLSVSLFEFQLRHVMEEETLQVFSFSHPLFSSFITLYTLFLIYFPYDLLRIFLSPVLLISGALLFYLLRLGSTRDSNTRPGNSYKIVDEAEESKVLVCDSDTKSDLICDFVEWNLRAPLEVIHEAYEENDEEEEEEANPSVSGENDPTRFREIERFPSLSLCYPESDSESGSETSSEFNFPEMDDWNSPENMGFRWEEDGIGSEGLIEIKLDHNCNKMMSKRNQTEIDFHAEEEGLIEIDLFP